MPFPEDAVLKDGTRIELRRAGPTDFGALRSLYDVIVEEGTSYPHDRLLNEEEFLHYWIS